MFVVATMTNRNHIANAQEESISIKLRLEQLLAEMEAGNLMIGFQFMAPISEERDYWLFGSTTADEALNIIEIEEDHFCFSHRSHQAVLIRCVPYTNVASISYLGD